jgi:phosphoglycolate phosphatase-like HAD superfamily hydrolase
MKILALDFDGVIVDSLRDAFVTGFNAYLTLFPSTKLLDGKKITYSMIGFDFFDTDLFDRFEKLRGYVNSGEHIIVAFAAIDADKKINSQNDFDKFTEGFSKKDIKRFEKAFYDERKSLKTDIREWYKLNHVFNIIAKVIRDFKDKERLYIVTSKDKDTVFSLCKKKKLGVNENNILDRFSELNKLKKLKQISKDLSIKEEDVYFIDDLLLHLLSIKENSNVNCFMASWGYNDKAQIKEAKVKGIKVLNEDDFCELVQSIVSD